MKYSSMRFTAFIAFTALVLTACATAQAAPTGSPSGSNQVALAVTGTAGPTQPPQITKEPIAAVVNDQVITLAVLDREVSRRIDGIRTLGDPMPADQNAFRGAVLDSLIDQMLIEQAAAIQGVKVSDADLDNEMNANISIAGSKEKWQAQLAADRLTEAEYRVGLRSALITAKMRDIVTANIPTTAEQVHARHILVADEATANNIAAKIKSGGDFAQLAGQFSLDVTTKQTGGDLGWFSRGQLLQKSVEDAAFALQPNQIGGPVKSDLGYHIIQTLERVKDRPVDPQTRYKLAEDAFEQWIQSLRKGAKIEKYPNGRT